MWSTQGIEKKMSLVKTWLRSVFWLHKKDWVDTHCAICLSLNAKANLTCYFSINCPQPDSFHSHQSHHNKIWSNEATFWKSNKKDRPIISSRPTWGINDLNTTFHCPLVLIFMWICDIRKLSHLKSVGLMELSHNVSAIWQTQWVSTVCKTLGQKL